MIRIILCIFFWFLSANSFASNEFNNNAQKYVDNFGNRVVLILEQPHLNIEKKRLALETILREYIDIEWISRFVLAKHYNTLDSNQRNDFKDTYYKFLISNYTSKFDNYYGGELQITDSISRGNYYIVKSLFNLGNNSKSIKFDFRLRRNPKTSEFRMLDVAIEGVSLIEAHRSDFVSFINHNGFEKFIANIKQKSLSSKDSVVN